ncbi:hypothetical protein GPECTOR_8g149 [Gonium pectorale]|uniref:RecF/RecN/SMC N-terminal domain-containing protein n=1 Tax=Gonium pectorale TaxID=33097 RepID=A0A150GSU0_GONPE|nr:hypothetical protein GPECTOR_8g149 [Gonium pectorale]|eukprot:KXZ52758.1 hypothetical protein GPECTOR_8g149 [Gonium pectorale]
MERTRAEELLPQLADKKRAKQEARKRRLALLQRLRSSQGQTEELREKRAARLRELAALEAEASSEAALARLREQQERIAAKQQELSGLQAAASDLESQRAALAASVSAAEARRSAATQARDEARRALTDASAARATAASTAAAAEATAAAGGATRELLYARWGRGVMALADEVARAPPGRFSWPPIGPVGMYLRRSPACEARYAPALEVALGSVMNSWIVARREEGDELRRMAARHDVRRLHTIIAARSERPNAYGTEPVLDERGRRWWRVVDLVTVDESAPPAVRATLINTVVDWGNAAFTVIVDDRATAHSVASGSFPSLRQRRIGTAYDVQCAEYVDRNGTMITTPHQAPRMLVLVADNRAALQEAARQAQEVAATAAREEAARREELAAAEAALAAAAQELGRLQAAARELQRQQAELKRGEAACRSQLAALEDGLGSSSSQAASAEVNDQLALLSQQLNQAEAAAEELTQQINDAAEEERQADADMDALQQESSQYLRRREELLKRLQDLDGRKGRAAEALTARQAELEALRTSVQEAQERIDQYEARLGQARESAAKDCSREEGLEALERYRAARDEDIRERQPNLPDAEREAKVREASTAKGLERWIESTRKAIERAETAAGGDLEAVSLRASALRREVDVAEEAVKSVAKKHAGMLDAQTYRNTKYRQLRDMIHRIAASKFGKYMRRRNFGGQLLLDHEGRRLELRVTKGNEQQQASSMMQLSGGERSFTTAALLLALGEVIGSSFRVMDEYDVYMDDNARKITTMAILEYAWRINPNSQLVLISPHDTATVVESLQETIAKCKKDGYAVPPASFLKINVMHDPQAGNPGQ